ncbi:AcrR family transcriptional regulator [Rhodoligotrophos appendicifer]|uniref:TetR/AcrR family transcriptional regulator n=1 Tax=Rhodoligotrophos appendicifer TaxID=987056 RepID=UPI001478A452|nr:TetR/AcrR family transcriptional regulator [Rhodoligotrophos appendicifer]
MPTQIKAEQSDTPRQAVVDAMLKLAALNGWRDLSLRDIARESGVSLANVRSNYSSKTAILTDFIKITDEAVLERAAKEVSSTEAHDRLFDVVMMRLEALAPYKTALKAIFRDAGSIVDDLPLLFWTQAASKHWMLVAADLEPRGMKGILTASGLALIYARVLRTWLKEDSPDLPRTMAELDRLLHRGERSLERLEGPMALCGMAQRMACDFVRQARQLRRERRASRTSRPRGSPDAETASI